jgi:hypothetical protein
MKCEIRYLYNLPFDNINRDATIHCHLYSNTLRRKPTSCKFYLQFYEQFNAGLL